MFNPYSLQGKTILVTGASSGIGKGIALECAKMGALVVITARNKSRLEETYKELEGKGHLMIISDLSDNKDIESLVDECPQLDGYVNSAGMPQLIPISHINNDNLSEIMAVNTLGPILLTSLLLKKKKLCKGASIVFIASIAGVFIAELGGASYATSKGAISGFVKGAAVDLGSKRIRVNSICPGLVKTNILEMAKEMFSEKDIQENIRKYPMKKFGSVEDVAYGAIYLLSDASQWVTGVNLAIDGGYTVL